MGEQVGDEKATGDSNRSEMYARLGRKTMEQISRKVQDDDVKAANEKGGIRRKNTLRIPRSTMPSDAVWDSSSSSEICCEDQAQMCEEVARRSGGDRITLQTSLPLVTTMDVSLG